MIRKSFALIIVIIGLIALVPASAGAYDDHVFFAETGHNLSGPFKAYWETNGGLPVFGYPTTEELGIGTGHEVQWFERARFEHHPENTAPYDVELGHFGREALEARYPNYKAMEAPTPELSGFTYIALTGHSVLPQFWQYWSSHGLEFGDQGVTFRESLALFGYPLTDPMYEKEADGQTYIAQYFERARFELHPEFAGTPYEVELGLLGNDALAAHEANCQPVQSSWTNYLRVDGPSVVTLESSLLSSNPQRNFRKEFLTAGSTLMLQAQGSAFVFPSGCEDLAWKMYSENPLPLLGQEELKLLQVP